MSTTRSAVVLLGAVAVSAFIAGVAADRLWLAQAQGPLPHEREEALNHFRRTLELSPEQMEHVKRALDDARGETQPTMEQTHHVIRAAVERAHARIRAVLRPEQVERFDEMIKHPPPPPGPGRRPDGPPGGPAPEWLRQP